jgi:hypothetical protein
VTLLSCELDVRVGGTYRFVFGHGASKPIGRLALHYAEENPDEERG